MKTSFDWKELNSKKCPNMICEGSALLVFDDNKKQYHCIACGYFISEYKLNEISKGKDSSFYQRKQKSLFKTEESKSFSKRRYQEALLAQEKEREYNRRKIEQQST